mgnify:CR=1 FL=1
MKILSHFSHKALSLSLTGFAFAEEATEEAAEEAEEVADEAELTTLEVGKLTVSTSPDFPPYEYLDDSGTPVGIEMEILTLIADKVGLELVVDAMDGAPGVYSARWMGEDTSYEVKNQAIIDRLEGLEGTARSARFVCAIAACFPDGKTADTEGVVEGQIAFGPAGEGGFGYDPIFFLPEYGKTTAELSPEEKNKISHRGKALVQIKEELLK